MISFGKIWKVFWQVLVSFCKKYLKFLERITNSGVFLNIAWNISTGHRFLFVYLSGHSKFDMILMSKIWYDISSSLFLLFKCLQVLFVWMKSVFFPEIYLNYAVWTVWTRNTKCFSKLSEPFFLNFLNFAFQKQFVWTFSWTLNFFWTFWICFPFKLSFLNFLIFFYKIWTFFLPSKTVSPILCNVFSEILQFFAFPKQSLFCFQKLQLK